MGLLAEIAARAGEDALAVMGVVPEGAAAMPEGVRSLVLLGPCEPGFWTAFTESAEYRDGAADPMDRWSARVISGMAAEFGAVALFPFGAEPPHPFISWALASGRAFVSPVHLLVHDVAGLWVSYRGALGLREALEAAPAARPCEGCAQPCLDACPAGVLTGAGYDLPGCHAWLDSAAGAGCMRGGCAVRAVCPVSRAYGRLPEQSAHHMRYFHR